MPKRQRPPVYPLALSDGCDLISFGYREAHAVPRFLLPKGSNMRVPSKARKSVVFIGSMANGVFTPRATGFLVQSRARDEEHAFPHLVTAEHVVSGMLSRGMEIFVRVNLKDVPGKRSRQRSPAQSSAPLRSKSGTFIPRHLGKQTLQSAHSC
jgi:hypothetical protein